MRPECCAVHYFKHNDMQDLERVLRRIVDSGRSMPLTRRFIVCEGISHTRGSIAPLRHIYHLKTKYKFRLVVDESLSFGVCGETGRGACEAAGLKPADVEIITGAVVFFGMLLFYRAERETQVGQLQRKQSNNLVYSTSIRMAQSHRPPRCCVVFCTKFISVL